ncbi:ABC transporter ATP-binding protein [Staphylococcus chromogenes]|nr:ABC transporter ATP-binding protein [Staphylococcus chromogenes]
MTIPTLLLENVTRTHQDGPHLIHALDHVSLEVRPGELVAVMGPSGSGKSTLLNVAGTLDTPTSGRVLIEGQDVSHMTKEKRADVRRKHVGFVFQSYNLIPTLTAAENIGLPLELDGKSRSQARIAARKALEDLQLGAVADRFPSDMSGGQRQRVAIARALVDTRKLLLADEPTGALDTATSEEVMALLARKVKEGAAGLLVTHEPRFAAYADRTIYLRDGKLNGGDR